MIHRRVIRLFSAALLAGFVLGCDDDEGPTGTTGPFLEVSPLFTGIVEGETKQLTATLDGNPIAVTWESSNPARVSVSPAGVVTGLDACAGAPATPVCTSNLVAITATAVSDPTMKRSASVTVAKLQGIPLQNGVAVTNLSSSGAEGSTVLYRIFVPTGATTLTVAMSGGTGDADLYVRPQSPPTPTAWVCRPFSSGNNETCAFPGDYRQPGQAAGETTRIEVTPGPWYIVIELFEPYAGVSLMATYN